MHEKVPHFDNGIHFFMNIFYPDDLPINAHREQIISTVRDNQVVVIAGDTGSGKTTQLPKMCLDALPDNDLLIGCTQPRRIAASSVASRVAEELGSLGNMVGYKIRFHDYTTPDTVIKFMTDGVLLAETRSDRMLSKYGVIIIDEAHERNLNIDFLLGYVKQLLPRRPDLRVIITSATIDTQSFAEHFANAPVVAIPGRTYPVTVHYRPVPEELYDMKDGDLDHCVATVCDLFSTPPEGDILVFLPTEKDIHECCRLLSQKIPQASVLPMYGRLPAANQRMIFKPQKKIKVVVATNVAETSVTVPGIRYVVDSGQARISQYNVRAKTTSLPITRISRASCDQRKGRCGRVGPGICIRLYDEEDYLDRAEYSVPELKRSNLAEVILQMISLDLGRPENFPFIDPPNKSAIREGYRLLSELGSINDQGQLTKRGRVMAKLPIDPCISRIILEAKEHNCLREIKIIAAVLAIQDPRIRPPGQEKAAEEARKIFSHPSSDFMVFLNIWNHYHADTQTRKSWSKLKKFCKSFFLSFQRMREWIDLHEQLQRLISNKRGFSDNVADASYKDIHQSLLAGFLRNIARKKQSRHYQGANNKELMIFPGSHQFQKSGQWVMAASFIETSKLYALTVATIEADWIEEVAKDLCARSWANPRWHKKSGQVIADETVSLFGLVLSVGRKVNFAKADPKNIPEARDIFIQAALVGGEINGSYRFLQKNLALKKKWQETEEKLRVRNIVADDLTFHTFYHNRLPRDVYDRRTLNLFLKKKRKQDFLFMTDEEILLQRPEENSLVDFPPFRTIGAMQIRVEYYFDPGSEQDGVTFRLPAGFASGVNADVFEWLVPGLLREKLTFLLKSLPKSIRKNLVPVNDTIDRLLDDIDFGVGSLFSTVEASILKQYKMLIPRSAWTENLPLHLQPRYVVFDETGTELCSGRNLDELRGMCAGLIGDVEQPTLKKDDHELFDRWRDSDHTAWDFDDLPATLTIYTPQNEVAGFLYPMLVPQPDHACVRVQFDKDCQTAFEESRKGLLYLYRLQFKDQFKALKKMCTTSFSGPSTLPFLDRGKSRKETIEDLLVFILSSIFPTETGSIPGREEFMKNIAAVKKRGLFAQGSEICQHLMTLFQKRGAVEKKIHKNFGKNRGTPLFPEEKRIEFENHLEDIFPKDFLTQGAPADLYHIERQLQCLEIRLDRFYANPAKDAQKAAQIKPHLDNLKEIAGKRQEISEEGIAMVAAYRRLVDEYRIAVFSPEMGTREKVSPKRLDQQWRALLAKC